MKYLGPTSHLRLNEAVAVVFLFAGLFVFLSLASYHPLDPSWDTVSGAAKAANLTGRVGAFTSDLCLQAFGLAAYALPVLILLLGWKWIRSSPIQAPIAKTIGAIMLVSATCAAFGLTGWKPIAGAIPAGGLAGSLIADDLLSSLNTMGAWIVTAAAWIVSIYLVSTFEFKSDGDSAPAADTRNFGGPALETGAPQEHRD
jgi:S-DNA-T family DNA segregation ATPase FtsK/SpoIIIE